MNNKFRRSAIVRQIRWLLIKNGLGEDEADAAIEKLHSDLTSNVINENDRLTILREIANRASKLRPGDESFQVSSVTLFTMLLSLWCPSSLEFWIHHTQPQLRRPRRPYHQRLRRRAPDANILRALSRTQLLID
jgi:hypothetical protein